MSTGGALDGTLTFGTDAWAPGAYEALLTAGTSVRSRAPFWLYAAGTAPSVRTGKTVYRIGEPIDVRWAAAPGSRWDWLGVYRAGEGAWPIADRCTGGYCGNLYYLLYAYTQSAIEGSAVIDASAFPGYTTWPLGRGRYRIRLFYDDGYRLLAVSNRFKIVAG
jgi:hypothetical protein